MDKERLSAYEYLGHETIGELKSEGYLLEHKKTGARVVLLENDDENKVFYIGFRTPPKESTGVMHILEHYCAVLRTIRLRIRLLSLPRAVSTPSLMQ